MVHVFSNLKATSRGKGHQGHTCKACPNSTTHWGPVIQMPKTIRHTSFKLAQTASKYYSESHCGMEITGKWGTPMSAGPASMQSMLNIHNSYIQMYKSMQKTHNQTLPDILSSTLWGRNWSNSQCFVQFQSSLWKPCWDRSFQDFFLKCLCIK